MSGTGGTSIGRSSSSGLSQTWAGRSTPTSSSSSRQSPASASLGGVVVVVVVAGLGSSPMNGRSEVGGRTTPEMVVALSTTKRSGAAVRSSGRSTTMLHDRLSRSGSWGADSVAGQTSTEHAGEERDHAADTVDRDEHHLRRPSDLRGRGHVSSFDRDDASPVMVRKMTRRD